MMLWINARRRAYHHAAAAPISRRLPPFQSLNKAARPGAQRSGGGSDDWFGLADIRAAQQLEQCVPRALEWSSEEALTIPGSAPRY